MSSMLLMPEIHVLFLITERRDRRRLLYYGLALTNDDSSRLDAISDANNCTLPHQDSLLLPNFITVLEGPCAKMKRGLHDVPFRVT